MKGKKIDIQKETLRNLYLSEHLNAYQIAKKLNYGSTTIYRKLEEYGIERRDNSECHLRYQRNPFSGDKNEMAYLIGFRLGDLHVRKAVDLPGCKTVRVEAHTTKQEQVELVKSLFEKYSHVHIKKVFQGNGIKRMTTIRILCFLDESFSFLLPKKDRVEEWMMTDSNLFLSFLAGYTDAEGHFGIHSRNGAGVFQIQSYDKEIVKSIQKMLVKIGIHSPSARIAHRKGYVSPSYPERSYNKDVWQVVVYSQSLVPLLYQLIPNLKHGKRKSDATKVLRHLEMRNND